MEFVIVAEDEPDAETARDLADRVLHAEPPSWLRLEEIRQMRTWTGLDAQTEFTRWRDIGDLYENTPRMPQYLGHERAGQSNDYDYAAARHALLLADRFATSGARRICAVVLVRDTDDQVRRRTESLKNAREDHSSNRFEVVLGIARPMREAWVLNGFEPQSDAEEERLQQERHNLPVDPLSECHELTASSPQAQNSCKRLVQTLTDGDSDRERACWWETDLDLLRERGAHTGLADYLEEVERLIPLFAHSS